MSNIVLISTAVNITLLVMLIILMGVFVFSQPRAINVFNGALPHINMAGVSAESGVYSDVYRPNTPVHANSAYVGEDPRQRPYRDYLAEPVSSIPVYADSGPDNDTLLMEFLATELVKSRTPAQEAARAQPDLTLKQDALQKQYEAREKSRKDLKAVYEAEIARLEALQKKGFIDRATVEKVRKEALRQDLELRDSLIMTMATSDAAPNLIPELPKANFRTPHTHDFVASNPRPLPNAGSHPSQSEKN